MPELELPELPKDFNGKPTAVEAYAAQSAKENKEPLKADSRIPIYKAVHEIAIKEYPAISRVLDDADKAQKESGRDVSFQTAATIINSTIIHSELRPAYEAKRLEGVIGEVAEKKTLQKNFGQLEKHIATFGQEITPEIKADLEKLKERINNIDKAQDRITDKAIEEQKEYTSGIKSTSMLELPQQMKNAAEKGLA